MTIKNRTILEGDVISRLEDIDNESIDCIISSPPYWALRDYGISGQLGLESNYQDYLTKLDHIMIECKRVLKKSGSVWINLGDTYAGSNKGAGSNNHKEGFAFKEKPGIMEMVKAKSRVGIPERFYINCIDNGWIARNNILWVKGNAMPESVTDRFSNKYENIFFFTKSKEYYFDLDSVRVDCVYSNEPNAKIVNHKQSTLGGGGGNIDEDNDKRKGCPSNSKELNNRNFMPLVKGKYKNHPEMAAARLHVNDKRKLAEKYNKAQDQFTKRILEARANGANHDNPFGSTKGKNPGDVFYINTKPYTGSHFATFPIELPLKILKCACPKDGMVLDPFFGAGTTGVAAEKLGLKWCGIELNPQYIEIARKRLGLYNSEKIGDY